MQSDLAPAEENTSRHAHAANFHEAQLDLQYRLLERFNTGITQRSVAREAGVSEATLSQWLKGKYQGDNIAVYVKLAKWEEGDLAEANARPAIPTAWVETETGRNIERTLLFAQTEPSIALVYGGAGVGKTTGIARYAASNQNVWVVTSSPASAAMVATLADVSAVLGMRGLPNVPHQVFRDIVNRVRGTRGLLIIDEAQHLSTFALDQLRSIHDTGGIGLCLSGNETVYSKMSGGSRKVEFAQLFSRVGCRIQLPSPTLDDVDAILSGWEIDGGEEIAFARRIALLPGGLRGLFQCLRQASMAARSADKPVDARLMRAAWRDLGGDL